MKDNLPAWQFCARKPFDEYLGEFLPKAQTVLLHARAATKGDPRDNNNNHPLDQGLCSVVHNGIINNDDWLFTDLKLKRKGEVDSDILRAVLDEHGLSKKAISVLQKCRGSAAIAAVSVKEPGKLLLARSGNPIVMGSTADMLVFASEKRFIHQTMRPILKRWGLLFQPNVPDLAFSTMNNNSAQVIGEKGLEWHQEFELCTQYTAPTYDPNAIFRRGRDRWQMEKLPDNVICPNPTCAKVNRIPDKLKDDPLYTLKCASCSKPLGSIPLLEGVRAKEQEQETIAD
jgi:asparagine synthetase B (glutamine-hydrolysing)